MVFVSPHLPSPADTRHRVGAGGRVQHLRAASRCARLRRFSSRPPWVLLRPS